MIVVSNTSPLTNLAAIGQFDLLRQLYSEVYIAKGVWAELNSQGREWPGRSEVAAASWVMQREIQNRLLADALQRDLDQGESESIALAVELGADMVLMDEKEGRHAAQRLRLRVIGVIGILLEAKAKGLLDQLRPQLDALRWIAGFYMSDSLYRSTLTLVGES